MIYIKNLFYSIVSRVGRQRGVLHLLHPAQDGRVPLHRQRRELPADDGGTPGHGWESGWDILLASIYWSTTLTRVAANFGFMLTVMNRKTKCGNAYDVWLSIHIYMNTCIFKLSHLYSKCCCPVTQNWTATWVNVVRYQKIRSKHLNRKTNILNLPDDVGRLWGDIFSFWTAFFQYDI